jgi:hypothetical protein
LLYYIQKVRKEVIKMRFEICNDFTNDIEEIEVENPLEILDALGDYLKRVHGMEPTSSNWIKELDQTRETLFKFSDNSLSWIVCYWDMNKDKPFFVISKEG